MLSGARQVTKGCAAQYNATGNGGDVGKLRACDSSKAFGVCSGQMVMLVGH